MADYDLDGKPDLFFVTNDSERNFLFHHMGNKFQEVAFETEVALPEEGDFISGMGLDFRDFNNDGYPDIALRGPQQADLSAPSKHGQRRFYGSNCVQRHARTNDEHGGLRCGTLRLR